jgi:Flp pilus assembly protein TadD
MMKSSSRKPNLRNAVAATTLLLLGACSTAQVAEEASMNIYGPETDEATRSRIDRLTKYCSKLSSGKNINLANGLCVRAHDLDPSNPLPLMILADNFQKVGENEKAIQSYRAILFNHPANAEVSYRLGKLQASLGRDAEAMETLVAGLEHSPKEPRLLNVIGVLKDQEGDHSTAQFYYRESLTEDPNNVSVENNLGLSLALSGQASEAVALLEEVVSEPGASDVSRRNLELAYAKAAEESAAAVTDDTAELEPVEETEASKAPTVLSPLYTLTSYISDSFPAERDVLVDSVQVAAVPEVPSLSEEGTATDAVDWDEGYGSLKVHKGWKHFTPGGRVQSNIL